MKRWLAAAPPADKTIGSWRGIRQFATKARNQPPGLQRVDNVFFVECCPRSGLTFKQDAGYHQNTTRIETNGFNWVRP